jgi:hypothetical protein
MATKDQYDFFKEQYLDEEKRYDDLTKRGEIYFSLLSILLTGIVFNVKDIHDILLKGEQVEKISSTLVLIVAFLLFAVGFLFIANSLRIRTFEAVTDLNDYLDKLKDDPPTNEDFFDDRIVDYIEAIGFNEQINTKRANDLAIALKFIMAGFILLIFFLVLIFSLNL